MAMAVILNGTLVNTLIPAGSGMLGVLIGGWLTALNQKQERREAHFKSQLSEFYSPLLGIRSQIKAKSELRLKLSSAAGAAWPAKFAGIEDPMLKKEISERDSPAYDKLQDYNNRQLTEEIVPLYRKMLVIFTDGMWLAEPSTIRHYAALVEFVEIWNRFLDQSLPREVLQQIEHKEETLQPLYADLEHNLSTLSKRLH
jgi:hypothetical protein